MNPMPPWICTPSDATSLPMSVENAFAIGVSSAPRAAASPRTFGVRRAHRDIHRDRGGIADRARGGGQRAHLHQHPLDVGMHDDGVEPVALLADGAALAALLRERQRLLVGAVGDADALEADAEPGLVHHREHAEHAAVFLADQVADRAALVAHRHGAGRRGMHAELVLDAAGDRCRCARRASRRH